nr:helix-turn-helix domain-containing protein [Ruegeria marisrubri]
MSHRAVNWALEQRHLKPGPWIVLIQLSDRHNKDTRAVFPDQFTIAADCNMSRATVNRHIDILEDLDLVRRVQRVHPVTKKQLGTHYILGLDFANPPIIEHAVSQIATRGSEGQNENKSGGRVSNCDTGAVSQKTQKPCLKNDDSRVSNCDTNHVKEPVKEHCVPTDAAHTQDFVFEDFVSQFETAYPRLGDGPATEAALKAAIEEGADPAAILAGARGYADEQKGNQKQYIAYSENWLRDKRWTRHTPTTSAAGGRERILETHAKTIKQGKPFLCTAITDQTAWECVQAELVTIQECRAVGKLL